MISRKVGVVVRVVHVVVVVVVDWSVQKPRTTRSLIGWTSEITTGCKLIEMTCICDNYLDIVATRWEMTNHPPTWMMAVMAVIAMPVVVVAVWVAVIVVAVGEVVVVAT